MELKYILSVKANFGLIFLFCSSGVMQDNQKLVEIIHTDCGVDYDRGVNFEGIKEMPNRSKFRTSEIYDSIIDYLQSGKLIEDSVSHDRGYGTNLEIYVGLSKNNSLLHEFGIDFQGYIFFNNKTFFLQKI